MKGVYLRLVILLLMGTISVGAQAASVKIAAIYAKTGKATVSNSKSLRAVRFAVSEINRAGGVLGGPIELIELDNRSSALYSRQMAEQAVKLGVSAVIGSMWSAHSLAMAPVLQAAKIPMLTPSSTNPEITRSRDYIFRSTFTDTQQAKVMAWVASERLDARTALVLTNSGSKYSLGLSEYFIRNFSQQRGHRYQQKFYRDTDKSFVGLLEKITKMPPDVIFLPGYAKDSGLLIKQARQLGLTASFLGGDGWGKNTIRQYAGDAVDGSYFTTHWFDPKALEALDQRLAKAGLNYSAESDLNALAYDGMNILAAAIERAGSREPHKIRDALASTKNFQGVYGKISFDANGDAIKPVGISRFTRHSYELVDVYQEQR
ncbi:ABC transporter substrate-binding protein [Dongshaea marina]|uniref:ABC transporter substrate-binding protein n=1 Tax=Dongshaea marina TaxID=2047966 RepID=UPI000D3EBAB1|nr:ABC transporter substrate-binding protein [Dongshaea marina]